MNDAENQEKNGIPSSLSRINAIRVIDPGLYALALHAFIEAQAKKALGHSMGLRFREILQAWYRECRDALISRVSPSGSESDLMEIMYAVIRDHTITNEVRHSFAYARAEEVLGMTWNFLRLGNYAGWSAHEAALPLRDSLMLWDKRENQEISDEQDDLQRLMTELQSRSAEILLTRDSNRKITQQIRRLKLELEDLSSGNDTTAGPIKKNIAHLSAELEKSEYSRYVNGLSRLTLGARTRRDFEKFVVRLSEEQPQALEDFSSDKDMLITGGTGTGKTLILL